MDQWIQPLSYAIRSLPMAVGCWKCQQYGELVGMCLSFKPVKNIGDMIRNDSILKWWNRQLFSIRSVNELILCLSIFNSMPFDPMDMFNPSDLICFCQIDVCLPKKRFVIKKNVQHFRSSKEKKAPSAKWRKWANAKVMEVNICNSYQVKNCTHNGKSVCHMQNSANVAMM